MTASTAFRCAKGTREKACASAHEHRSSGDGGEKTDGRTQRNRETANEDSAARNDTKKASPQQQRLRAPPRHVTSTERNRARSPLRGTSLRYFDLDLEHFEIVLAFQAHTNIVIGDFHVL